MSEVVEVVVEVVVKGALIVRPLAQRWYSWWAGNARFIKSRATSGLGFCLQGRLICFLHMLLA